MPTYHITFGDTPWEVYEPTTRSNSPSSTQRNTETRPASPPSPQRIYFNSLKSSFISAHTHNALISHFHRAHPNGWIHIDEELEGSEDGFFDCYWHIFCKNDGRNIAYWPECYRSVLEAYLLFYACYIHPYFTKLGCEKHYIDYEESPRTEYLWILWMLGRNENFVYRKWRAGLLRLEQIWLLGLILQKTMWRIRILLRVEMRDEVTRLVEMMRIGRRARRMVEFFSALRAERLEVLVVGYLENEAVRREVVGGLDKVQRRWEDDGGEWEYKWDSDLEWWVGEGRASGLDLAGFREEWEGKIFPDRGAVVVYEGRGEGGSRRRAKTL
ncbi:hypothetical protein BJ508DRAFT_365124 [Ascobolus immersus RN42]|uniref:Uncharacterized protein n=1 Tax=Ascobolus immersus RN42 TaxID=1160509 RepID=A0A3N4HSN5_ASCIM|nr:hypothetical protein BJ508DRAFT_365124 [Ascobolus immersus RN42]